MPDEEKPAVENSATPTAEESTSEPKAETAKPEAKPEPKSEPKEEKPKPTTSNNKISFTTVPLSMPEETAATNETAEQKTDVEAGGEEETEKLVEGYRGGGDKAEEGFWQHWYVNICCCVFLCGVPILTVILFCLFSAWFAGDIAGAQPYKTWNYGALGPSQWPHKCRYGDRQSPIDIQLNNLQPMQIRSELNFADYDKTFRAVVRNAEHGLQIAIPPEYSASVIGGSLVGVYRLYQIKFHWAQHTNGSEHTINGKHYPLEIQFVHIKTGYTYWSALIVPDGIAIVSVLAQVDDRVRDLPTIAYLERAMPELENDASETTLLITPAHFLPYNRRSFFRYDGSLTTPDCDEAVVWTVMEDTVRIGSLRTLRGMDDKPHQRNNRPTQALKGRTVKYRNP